MVETRTVILYPHLGPDSGLGHIKRLMPFLYDSRFKAYMVHRDFNLLSHVAEELSIDGTKILDLKNISSLKEDVDLVLLDNRKSDRYLFDSFKEIAPVVAIDEGGEGRNLVSYTIDILPNLMETEANYSNTGLLNLDRKESSVKEVKRILVTFGGQDPYNLTEKITREFKKRYEITTVVGPLFKQRDFGVNKVENPGTLKDIIPEFDLVITSFGLTAYEAVSSGIPVALYNPTEYHSALGKKAGFYQLKSRRIRLNIKKAKESIKKVDLGHQESLTDFIYNLTVTHAGCPVCRRKSNQILYRFTFKSFYHCSHCMIDYLQANHRAMEYKEDYFFSDYKEQYGKTYLEDFNQIKNMGKERLKWIKKKMDKGGSILDIGCAYGPFLKACEEAELKPYGLDISENAVEYVNSTLNIPALCSSFPLVKPLDFHTPFSAASMWFVIEHFRNLDQVLSQVNTLIKKGGVFAFSTPNGSGISSLRDKKKFLSNSPIDHFTILTPKSARKLLKEYGFKVYKINVTGHHPERFGKFVKGTFMLRLAGLVSRLFGLGDTFEIYTIKDREL